MSTGPCFPFSFRLVACGTLLLFLPASLAAQQNSLKVIFQSDSSRNTVAGLFRDKGIVYASLKDLARIFGTGTFENTEARKFEVKPQAYRVKVSAGNPFVVITDQNGRQSVQQLSHNVVFAAGSYFIPLSAFLPYFEVSFGTPASFDAVAGILRIGVAAPPNRFDIPTLSLEPKVNGVLIRIPARKRFADLESWLRQDGWLYLTIPEARADIDSLNRVRPKGLVKEIVAIQSPTSVQLTFKLAGKIATTELLRGEDSTEILLSVRAEGVNERKLLEKRQEEIRSGLESQRNRWKLDAIVLDPGHGGRDWGATGVTGVREKDITLGITLKLGRLIQKNLKDVRVIYTRKTDTFVELDRRGQIANEAGGKLFISIHCNSLAHKPSPTRGFEVYLLRPGKTDEAIAIAERENSPIKMEEGYEKRYKELTEENFILVAMAQSAYVKASERYADILQKEMEKTTGIPNSGVKQAGFYVLVGAAMPNVLVESAYLSNRQEERYLKSDAGQQKIAEAIFRAIRKYKGEYERVLQEGKDVGASQ